jgi:hypothetical protein
MAISYDLDMATPMPVAQVARELADAVRTSGLSEAEAPVAPEHLLGEGAITALGTWLQVYDPRPEPWEPVITDLGITPTASAGFRLNKEGDLPGQQDDMIRLVCRLLDRVPGDAVLANVDRIWLLRRNGDLSVSDDPDLWPPQRLAAVPQPYRRRPLKFSEE